MKNKDFQRRGEILLARRDLWGVMECWRERFGSERYFAVMEYRRYFFGRERFFPMIKKRDI